MDHFDRDALEPEAGIRAIWLLYRRGAWGVLEDFGVSRTEVETALDRFAVEDVVTGRLTKAQCRRLVTLVPALEGASTELRLTYALSYIDRKEAVMKHFIGEVDNDAAAFEVAEMYSLDVLEAGGHLNVVQSRGDGVAQILLEMPEDTEDKDVVGLCGELRFKRTGVVVVPAVPDQGIPLDEVER